MAMQKHIMLPESSKELIRVAKIKRMDEGTTDRVTDSDIVMLALKNYVGVK